MIYNVRVHFLQRDVSKYKTLIYKCLQLRRRRSARYVSSKVNVDNTMSIVYCIYQ